MLLPHAALFSSWEAESLDFSTHCCVLALPRAALPEAEARVEAAILRDFGKALSKLVRKVDKREDEIREIARQQAVQRAEANNKMAAMSHESLPLATNTWREGSEGWGPSLPANGVAGSSRSSFQHMLQVTMPRKR